MINDKSKYKSLKKRNKKMMKNFRNSFLKNTDFILFMPVTNGIYLQDVMFLKKNVMTDTFSLSSPVFMTILPSRLPESLYSPAAAMVRTPSEKLTPPQSYTAVPFSNRISFAAPLSPADADAVFPPQALSRSAASRSGSTRLIIFFIYSFSSFF